jgi:hypothetical protein
MGFKASYGVGLNFSSVMGSYMPILHDCLFKGIRPAEISTPSLPLLVLVFTRKKPVLEISGQKKFAQPIGEIFPTLFIYPFFFVVGVDS